MSFEAKTLGPRPRLKHSGQALRGDDEMVVSSGTQGTPVSENQYPAISFNINEDRTRATVQVGSETMLLTADGVQNLITHFGALRAQLQPAVSDKPPANGQFLQLDAPVVEITVTPDGAFVGMLLRTLTYGWIGCAFRAADARSIGEYLVRGLGAEAEPPTA